MPAATLRRVGVHFRAFASVCVCGIRLFVVGFVTAKRSAVEAFYSLDPEILVAFAVFPVLVWMVNRRMRSRDCLRGVVIGVVSVPVLAMIAVGISFSRP